MSKITQYLQEHLLGEVISSPDVRRHLAHDSSVVRMIPLAAVYPRDESDIRKTTRFCWQLAERGRTVPITARGGGSDTSGGALGTGLIMLPTAHMNRILEFEPKKKRVVVEPGITYDKLQQTLYTHGLFFPSYPPNGGFATVGGGLASGAVGEQDHRHGPLLSHVESLRVVLSNGEVIETGPLTHRELNKKMGLSNLEGQIYRAVDKLLEDNEETVARLKQAVAGINNNVGYRLEQVRKAGQFDLTPIFVGSQGSLGIVSETRLKLVAHHPTTTLAMVSLGSYDDLAQLIKPILALKPSLFDFVSQSAIDVVNKLNPTQLASSLDVSKAAVHLFIEFDDPKTAARQKCLKTLTRLVQHADGYVTSASEAEDQQRLCKLRQSVTTILLQPDGAKRAVPVADNLSVPADNLVEFLKNADRIFTANTVTGPMWGHVGSGVVRLFVHLDLAEVGDRQRYFKLTESLYSTAIAQGGSISACGEGRTGSPYVAQLYGKEFTSLMSKLKNIFDPHGILNPGVKSTSMEELIALMRTDYNLAHRHEHLPRS